MLDDLPQDIFLEILLRVPVNFLKKCISVSKTWYSLIKNPDFIYSHLENSNSGNTKDPHSVRLISDEGPRFSLYFESFESHEHFHKQLIIPLVFGPAARKTLSLIGHSNGIFCYALTRLTDDCSYNYQYLLWNPSIQKYFTLPPSNYKRHSIRAFVFDSNVNDFKVFAANKSFEVELYSLRSRSWKIISVDHPNFNLSFTDKYIFVDRVIYFEVDHRKLICFDLADEAFDKIMLPKSLQRSDYRWLIQYENTSIAIVAYCPFKEILELWFMEEMSASGIWKKVLLNLEFAYEYEYHYVSFSFFGVWKGRLLFESLLRSYGRVTSLDLNSQLSENVALVERDWSIGYYYYCNKYDSIQRYEETLALLDNGKDISVLEEELGILD